MDGDSDRNTILGQNAFFVTPYDSLVVLANNLEHLPWFKANGQEGQGRRGEVYVHQRVNVKRANWSKKLGDTGLRLGGAIIKGSLQKKYVTHFGGWGCLGQNQCHPFFLLFLRLP